MNKSKILNFFHVFTLKQWGIASIIVVAAAIAGFLLSHFAYQFGATCFEGTAFESILCTSWLLVILFRGLLFFSYILSCIILAFMKRRIASLRLLLLLPVLFVGFFTFLCITEPLQFHCLKGFVAEVPQAIDVETIQDWLDNAELEQTDGRFKRCSYDEFPEEVAQLNPGFISIYNHNNNRAIKIEYGNRATSTLFGIVVTGKNVDLTEIKKNESFRWCIQEIDEHCYIWSRHKLDKSLVAKLSDLETCPD